MYWGSLFLASPYINTIFMQSLGPQGESNAANGTSTWLTEEEGAIEKTELLWMKYEGRPSVSWYTHSFLSISLSISSAWLSYCSFYHDYAAPRPPGRRSESSVFLPGESFGVEKKTKKRDMMLALDPRGGHIVLPLPVACPSTVRERRRL